MLRRHLEADHSRSNLEKCQSRCRLKPRLPLLTCLRQTSLQEPALVCPATVRLVMESNIDEVIFFRKVMVVASRANKALEFRHVRLPARIPTRTPCRMLHLRFRSMARTPCCGPHQCTLRLASSFPSPSLHRSRLIWPRLPSMESRVQV